MKPRGRGKNRHIKNLVYDKWYTVGFKFLNDLYVLCRIDKKMMFKNITEVSSFKLSTIICRVNKEETAQKLLDTLPPIIMGGFEREVEIIPNYLLEHGTI